MPLASYSRLPMRLATQLSWVQAISAKGPRKIQRTSLITQIRCFHPERQTINVHLTPVSA
jgi:hypothetical protein